MDHQDLQDLGRRARDERTEPVDVRWRVQAALARLPAAADRTLLACAAGSLAAAVLVAALARPAWESLDEPFAGLFAAFADGLR
jgi:hypothetical protein